ncbi:MAG: glycosyltransferase family 2 protein [Ilumatobacteraceae bacterium]
MPPELSVVLPAHNEVGVIASVIDDVVATARRLVGGTRGAGVQVIVVDDASTDGTSEALDELAARHAEVTVVHLLDNVGHGPALRAGWERATGEWVAHLDSDAEVPADQLDRLWAVRADADLVLGVRTQRTDTTVRRFVTWTLKSVARIASGRRLRDANTPCKIVRRSSLKDALTLMPPDAFAPSVLLAVAVARRHGRVAEVEVVTRPRSHGTSWLVPTTLARGCARSMVDTVRVAWRAR